MLVFSNREIVAGKFSAKFAPRGEVLAAADVDAGGNLVKPVKNITDADAAKKIDTLFTGSTPVMVYVHGNNNTPESCFGRLKALQKLYPGVEVVGFSWPSEGYLSDGTQAPGIGTYTTGDESDLKQVKPDNTQKGGISDKIQRYHYAQVNSKNTTDAFARFLRLLAASRLKANKQPFSLAIHSLGAQLFQYSLDVDGATESVGAAYNVALLAPCVRAAGHSAWITRFRPKGRTYVTYNAKDTVLFGAYIADSEQFKLGADPGSDLVQWDGLRYICFTNSPVGAWGHGYFVDGVKGKELKLFGNIFGSQRDFGVGGAAKSVYRQGCDADGTTCYMGVPDPVAP